MERRRPGASVRPGSALQRATSRCRSAHRARRRLPRWVEFGAPAGCPRVDPSAPSGRWPRRQVPRAAPRSSAARQTRRRGPQRTSLPRTTALSRGFGCSHRNCPPERPREPRIVRTSRRYRWSGAFPRRGAGICLASPGRTSARRRPSTKGERTTVREPAGTGANAAGGPDGGVRKPVRVRRGQSRPAPPRGACRDRQRRRWRSSRSSRAGPSGSGWPRAPRGSP